MNKHAAKGSRSSKQKAETQEQVLRALEYRKARQEAFREADRACNRSVKTIRLLESCASLAVPGAAAAWVDRDSPASIQAERHGHDPDWEKCNLEFCQEWVARWLEAIPFVKTAQFKFGSQLVAGLEGVKKAVPASPFEEITKDLFLRLLQARYPRDEAEGVVGDLAQARADLGSTRFEMQKFFNRLKVKRSPPARQLQSSRMIEELVSSLSLSPTDETLLDYLLDQTQRRCTSAIAMGTETKEKSIGKNLVGLQESGLIDNNPRFGYALTPIGRLLAAELRRQHHAGRAS